MFNTYIGPFYLTQLLMSAILKAAESSPDKARVILTSSSVQNGVKWNTLTDTPARKKTSSAQRYGQSKLVRGCSSPVLRCFNVFSRRRQTSCLRTNLHADMMTRMLLWRVLFPVISLILCFSYSHPDTHLSGGVKAELQRHLPSVARMLLVNLVSLIYWNVE